MLKSFRRQFDALWNGHRKKTKSEDDVDDFFPRVIVNCRYGNVIKNGRSKKGFAPINRSFRCPKPSLLKEIQCNEILTDWLNYLYYLYSTQKIEDQEKKDIFWGTCAEDDAANKVLNECDDQKMLLPTKMTDLNFTKAIRPRTRECIPYCKICEKIFG